MNPHEAMSHDGIDIQVIDRLDELLSIHKEWASVQDSCEHKHVFLDHRFICAWWRHFGQNKSMYTLVLRRKGVIEGIVPLMISRGWEVFPTRGEYIRIAEDYGYLPATRWRRVVPVRRLSFPLNFASSNIRGHFLLRQPDTQQIAALLKWCQSIRSRWDMLCLDGIPDSDLQEKLLTSIAPLHGLRQARSRHSRRILHSTLPTSMEEFLAQRSGSFRRWLRRAQRQTDAASDKAGNFLVREYRGDTIDEGINQLFAIERQSWKSTRTRKRELHLDFNDQHRAFYRDVAQRFSASDEAQILVTEIDGQAASAMFSLQRQQMISCVLTYQSEALKERVSVAPLWQQFFELAIERRLKKVDFNGNNSYLARYADGETRFNRLTFYNGKLYSSLLRTVADAATTLVQVSNRP